MAPRQSKKSHPTAAHSEEEDENQEDPQSSQDHSVVDLVKQAQQVLASGQKRRDSRRKVIEVEHEQRVCEVKAKIESLIQDRNTRVAKLEKEALDRLEALNAKRESLEKSILASINRIESQTNTMAIEMNAMLHGRLEDLEESSSQFPEVPE
ncbi:hypothetical protein G7Y89_g12171 [Cudoniella acicularis]|uniref:Uncharacterized protein n=1 Tax=Cudoniella acicularis TaxID=354080 RepID=A0A8H4VXA0_9HELO|nr:hypothetical protein G7Y89_g12171 [Cudoniella acicularis]